ncbi:ABC transporter substrate-binding protein [Spongisporangium articulatum]|uniref:ABC transporter substrate-binding protein n=1 Tax=Spongisporangium articulatum TaxID=3362603 RepID=A0ABW8AMA5_9ACTN
MIRRRSAVAVAAAAAASLVLAACGGGSSGGGSSSTELKQNAGLNALVNPSDAKGGTMRIAQSGDWDSLDPGNMYYAFAWNFARLYTRSLTTFSPEPGPPKVVPDLAESLGKSSDDGKTWTYTLRQGVKFEDGTPVTSKDVKYGVERSMDKTTFPNGPTYFNDWLALGSYKNAYDSKGKTDPAIETPDDRTIIFHLKKAYTGFDFFGTIPATAPVPADKDTGSKYQEHVVSSGPYMFKTYSAGKGFTLVRNPNWDQATDPIRKALPDGYDVSVNVNADDVDNRLLAGDLDMDVAGAGVQPAAQAKILANKDLTANTDIIPETRLNYLTLHDTVKPFDNINCRKAIEYGVSRQSYYRAYGGKTGGEIATNITPPNIAGAKSFDLYPRANNGADVAKAKEALAACGQPNGFSTTMAYRGERPKEKAVAQAVQQDLAAIGVKVTLKTYPAADYFALYAGNNAFVKNNKIGLNTMAWGADWPDGFGFLSQIVDPRVIRPAGNTNLGVTDPAVATAIDKALTAPDLAAQQAAWVEVDRKTMEGAYIVPGSWGSALYYRPTNVTNVFGPGGYGMYDYLNMGLKSAS